jgi:hypothetical protein
VFEDDIDKRKWMRTQPSYGPDWDFAIEFGIDISLIESNLKLSFEERLLQLEAMQKMYEALAGRAVPDGQADRTTDP